MILRSKMLRSIAALALALGFSAGAAQAHTVQICWKDVGPVTTFYAGSYHSPYEAPSPVGSIIVDGFAYPFSGWILPASLPATAHCWSSPTYGTPPAGNPDGVPNPGVVHYQTFTSAFALASHAISFDSSTAIQSPWGPFPAQTFGGGACADADFDGICNNVDACPLDFSNDADLDGICGDVDNCPLNANPTQTDANNNGQGDACEGVVCGNGLIQGAEQCDDGNIAGGDGCSAICTIELANRPPHANAGPDQSADEGQVVALDGTASNDPDNDALTYTWTQVPGGTAVTLTGANSATPSFTSPTVASGGETLTFRLTVGTAVTADIDTDEVSITIVNVNHTPVADAGIDQSIAEGAAVALDGSGSFDIDNDALGYFWEQQSGPAVILSDASAASPSFTAPVISAGGAAGVVATLVFKLTVDDGDSPDAAPSGFTFANVSDTMTVAITNVNNAPTANAGPDQTLNENSATSLNANGSSDPDSDPLSYTWLQVAGPVVALSNADTATPSLMTPFVSPGGSDLTFTVTADDGYGGSNTDTVVIHVQNANDPPLVSAARPTESCLWPPDHSLREIGIVGISDPDDNATIAITSITQDEPTNGLGDGDTAIDAVINANGTALLRAERSGTGDGRVYHINFTASDVEGSASGSVTVCVQHSKKKVAVDGGALYDSTY